MSSWLYKTIVLSGLIYTGAFAMDNERSIQYEELPLIQYRRSSETMDMTVVYIHQASVCSYQSIRCCDMCIGGTVLGGATAIFLAIYLYITQQYVGSE